jgi:hypothetical protein
MSTCLSRQKRQRAAEVCVEVGGVFEADVEADDAVGVRVNQIGFPVFCDAERVARRKVGK